MQVTQLEEVLQMPNDAVIYALKGKVKKIYKPKEGVRDTDGKPFRFQDVMVTNDRITIKTTFKDRDILPNSWQGHWIYLLAHQGDRGWTGIKAKFDDYKKANIVWVTPTAEIVEATIYEQQNPQAAQPAHGFYQPPHAVQESAQTQPFYPPQQAPSPGYQPWQAPQHAPPPAPAPAVQPPPATYALPPPQTAPASQPAPGQASITRNAKFVPGSPEDRAQQVKRLLATLYKRANGLILAYLTANHIRERVNEMVGKELVVMQDLEPIAVHLSIGLERGDYLEGLPADDIRKYLKKYSDQAQPPANHGAPPQTPPPVQQPPAMQPQPGPQPLSEALKNHGSQSAAVADDWADSDLPM